MDYTDEADEDIVDDWSMLLADGEEQQEGEAPVGEEGCEEECQAEGEALPADEELAGAEETVADEEGLAADVGMDLGEDEPTSHEAPDAHAPLFGDFEISDEEAEAEEEWLEEDPAAAEAPQATQAVSTPRSLSAPKVIAKRPPQAGGPQAIAKRPPGATPRLIPAILKQPPSGNVSIAKRPPGAKAEQRPLLAKVAGVRPPIAKMAVAKQPQSGKGAMGMRPGLVTRPASAVEGVRAPGVAAARPPAAATGRPAAVVAVASRPPAAAPAGGKLGGKGAQSQPAKAAGKGIQPQAQVRPAGLQKGSKDAGKGFKGPGKVTALAPAGANAGGKGTAKLIVIAAGGKGAKSQTVVTSAEPTGGEAGAATGTGKAGTKGSGKSSGSQQHATAGKSAQEVKCACGSTFGPVNKFCSECGTKRPEEVKCACGSTFGPVNKFCSECGTKRPEELQAGAAPGTGKAGNKGSGKSSGPQQPATTGKGAQAVAAPGAGKAGKKGSGKAGKGAQVPAGNPQEPLGIYISKAQQRLPQDVFARLKSKAAENAKAALASFLASEPDGPDKEAKLTRVETMNLKKEIQRYDEDGCMPEDRPKRKASEAELEAPAPKRGKVEDEGNPDWVDKEGRRFDLSLIVVNFANVGATFGKKVLNREAPGMFDWDGVRRCLRFLKNEKGWKLTGVINQDFYATDQTTGNNRKVGIPQDIMTLCEGDIQETPRIQGGNHSSADDEMTIKLAYRRNCRFLDNDNYRDWHQQLRDERQRDWLNSFAELLQARYYFDSRSGAFDLIEGNVPAHLLAAGVKSIDKKQLWSASRG